MNGLASTARRPSARASAASASSSSASRCSFARLHGAVCCTNRFAADTRDQALSLAEQHAYDLILVNRILARDRSPGMDVITALLGAQPGLHVMLVSDKPDAQAEAVKAGAIPGFGKARLDSDQTEQLLRTILSESESP